MFDIYLLMKFV